MAKKKDIEARKKAIDACRDKHGRILPKLVVEAAKNPRSPLHKEFEWDDKKAGYLWRLNRAQELIREIKMRVEYDTITVACPVYVSDPSSRESAYIATSTAARKEELAESILLDELRRIESAVTRARGIAAAFDLVSHFDRMLSGVVEVRGKLHRRRDGDESRPSA